MTHFERFLVCCMRIRYIFSPHSPASKHHLFQHQTLGIMKIILSEFYPEFCFFEPTNAFAVQRLFLPLTYLLQLNNWLMKGQKKVPAVVGNYFSSHCYSPPSYMLLHLIFYSVLKPCT